MTQGRATGLNFSRWGSAGHGKTRQGHFKKDFTMNNCCFSGRLTRDAETKNIRDDLSITSFSLAVDCGFGDKKRVEFINVKAFRKDALAPHLTKGNAIAISGEYQEEKWEKDGQKHSRVVILANHIEFQQGGGKADATPPTTGQPPAQYNANNDMDDLPF